MFLALPTFARADEFALSSRGPSVLATPADLNITAPADGVARRFSWDFGDNSAPVIATSPGRVSHAYVQPGHYSVVVKIDSAHGSTSRVIEHTVYPPRTDRAPAHSTPIVYDEAQDRVFSVNPDNDSIAVIDAASNSLLQELPVPRGPRTLALGPDNSLWVTSLDAAAVSVFDATTLALRATIALPRASQPFGIALSPDGRWAYVSLQATGELVRLDARTARVESRIAIGPTPRAIAVSADNRTLYVTRFLSPQDHAEVMEISAEPFALRRTLTLAPDDTPDSDRSSRGVPNYLMAIALTPDGTQVWITSKKDNIFRGLAHDGQIPTFETTVRSLVLRLDLATGRELPKLDVNDLDLPAALAFSPNGDLAFVATHGTRSVQIIDAFRPERTLTSLDHLGLGVSGLALDGSGTLLFVQCWLERTVEVYDLSGIIDRTTNRAERLAVIPTVIREKLSPQILLGKRIFHDASDKRMNRVGYISCASCHLDGDGDGRVWDFTDRGEGLRNTTDLRGRRGTGHGPIHWSANFDEAQDFEHDMRGPFGGNGFLPDSAFHHGSRDQTFGDPKAGLSPELDALAAFLASLDRVPPSPHRTTDGSLTIAAERGKKIFASAHCLACHGGPDFTNSTTRTRHDVGTLQKTSGQRLRGVLDGLDTPTLKGVWATAPYLHDGSAPNLADVIHRAQADPAQRHGRVRDLTPSEVADLVAYLEQLDESEAVPSSPQ